MPVQRRGMTDALDTDTPSPHGARGPVSGPARSTELEVGAQVRPSVAAGPQPGVSAHQSTTIPEQVRIAAELAANGEEAKARDLVQRLIRQCDSPSYADKDCVKWLRSLQAISRLFDGSSERKVITNSLNMQLVRIPAGEYMMGSPKQEMDWLRLTFRKIWREGHKQWFQDEMPLHPVRITKGVYMGATEVTVGQFREFVRSDRHKTEAEKSDGGMIYSLKEARWTPKKDMKWDSVPWTIADDQPVVFVSWNDAQAFCKWLSRKEKRKYRLPTEAEWERACRGGLVWARFPWGDRLFGDRDGNFGDGNSKLPESLTTVSDGFKHVAPVASYPPNGFGLYDMDGNVMEWVEDRYDRNYYENSPLEDPKGPSIGGSRVNKGGNWYASPADCRCAFRGFSGPEMSFWNLGFRVVMEEDGADATTAVAARTENQGSAGANRTPALPPAEEEGMSLFRQAMFAAQQQQWDEAIEDLEKALKIYEKREDLKWMARVRATLAGVYAERNRKFKAKELYTKALAEFRQIGDQNSVRIILDRMLDLETSPGVKINEIRKDGPASKAGLVVGDIIIEYAGETGFNVQGFKSLVNDHARASHVTISILHDEEIHTFTVPGGPLGVAVEDIKRLPRPRPTTTARPQQDRGRDRSRQRPPRRDRDRR
ncbi:MAG: SUMF1/EgtB/PvdO family nonheme iron enzyme [Thermodesulfobacteriota bacterium]